MMDPEARPGSKPDVGLNIVPPVYVVRFAPSKTRRLLTFLVIALFAWFLLQVLVIYVENKDILDWWAKNDASGECGQVMSIWHVLLSQHGNLLLVKIHGLFLPESMQLSQGQLNFLTTSLLRYQRYHDEAQNKQKNILTPRQLTHSLLLHTGDGDELYDAWFAQNKHIRTEDGALTFLESTENGETTYIPQKIESTGLFGVYPSADQHSDWRGVILMWLNGTDTSNSGAKKWCWKQSADHEQQWQPVCKSGDTSSAVCWFDIEKQPSNFLARYGISPDSAILSFFCNDRYSFNGYPVDVQAYKNLIRTDMPVGGWMGFMKGMGDNLSGDSYTNILFSKAETSKIAPLPSAHCPPAQKALNVIAGAAGSIMPLMIMAWPLAAPGFIAAAVVSLFLGANEVATAYSRPQC
jgi:hypothetical protein